jgi:hypothetical protein
LFITIGHIQILYLLPSTLLTPLPLLLLALLHLLWVLPYPNLVIPHPIQVLLLLFASMVEEPTKTQLKYLRRSSRVTSLHGLRKEVCDSSTTPEASSENVDYSNDEEYLPKAFGNT